MGRTLSNNQKNKTSADFGLKKNANKRKGRNISKWGKLEEQGTNLIKDTFLIRSANYANHEMGIDFTNDWWE